MPSMAGSKRRRIQVNFKACHDALEDAGGRRRGEAGEGGTRTANNRAKQSLEVTQVAGRVK